MDTGFTNPSYHGDNLKTVHPYRGDLFPVFGALGLEIAAKCNRHCVFCPNHDFKRPDSYMPMELIQKTTLELQAMNYHGRWSPYIYNEPLRDERLLAIIAFVHSHVPRASIMINTNADYLTEKYLDALFKAGVNQLALNVYSARDGHKDPANVESGIRIAKARAAVLQKWLDKRRWIDQNQFSLHALQHESENRKGAAQVWRAERRHEFRRWI